MSDLEQNELAGDTQPVRVGWRSWLWRNRYRLLLGSLAAVVLLWIVGDLVYAQLVAREIHEWESNVSRDKGGVLQGCDAYTVGEGDTALLLVHGINDSPCVFHKMAPALADLGFTCRVMRLPGFAEPIEAYADATRQEWLAAVESEVEQLKTEHVRVAIIAHSLGGAVAIGYLLKHPASVDSVALIAPAIEVSNSRSPLLSARAWHEIGSRLLFFTRTTASPFEVDCHDPAERDYEGRTPFTPVAVLEEMFELLDNNHTRAAELETPLLMVLSKQDQIIDWEAAKDYYDDWNADRKRLLFLPRSGHVVPLDYDWKAVTGEIAAFVGI